MKKMIFILAATLGLCCMDCRSMMAQELQVQESVVREQEHVTKPSKAGGLKTKTLSQNQVKLSWKKSAGASAYKIYKRYPGSKYKLVHATTKTSCVIPIRTDRTYRFMVVPYVKKNDKTVKGQADTIVYRLNRVTISAAGDCTLGSDSRYNQKFISMYDSQKNPAYFLRKVKPIFETDDVTIVNFEGTLTNANDRAIKKFTFKGREEFVQILKTGSVEVVNMANNHTYDYKQVGFEDTVRVLKKNNIPYCIDPTIAYKQVDGTRVAFLGYNALGSNATKEKIKSGIQKAKKDGADLIVVSFHWGIEGDHYPTNLQKDVGHYAIDQGADLVLGHHPHVLQGVEQYKDSYIVYSLGNFCFGGNSNPSDKDTMIYRQSFYVDNNGKKLDDSKARIIPCSLSGHTGYNDFQPYPLGGSAKKTLLERIRRFSSGMHVTIDEKGMIN